VVRRAEDVARLAPENPEFMPAIKQQATNLLPPSAKRPPPSIPSTAPKWRPQHQRGEEAGLIAAGFFSDTTGFETVANSNGVFGYQT
jgi:hypothetical protein